ncbi:MAG: MFS transporter, partial [Deltaproteobacteria bacterium]|nr:MFS transporter [Deltaproteobacteria bacterium]
VGFLSAWVAPWVTGWIKDTTGSFSAGLYLASGLLVLVVLLPLAIKQPRTARQAG